MKKLSSLIFLTLISFGASAHEGGMLGIHVHSDAFLGFSLALAFLLASCVSLQLISTKEK